MHAERHEPPQYTTEHLIEAGRAALRDREYEQAARLLREAARRAPMRQDVREMLGMAVDGTLAVRRQARDEEPQPSAPLAALRAREAFEHKPGEPRIEGRRAAVIETFIPAGTTPHTQVIELQPPRAPRGGRAQSTFGARITTRPAEIPEPTNFAKRHRRGPLSALLLTFIVGVLICSTAGALVWGYIEHGDKFGLRPTADQIKLQQATNQADEYLAMGKVVLAIDVLERLPISPQRNAKLSDIHMRQGEKAIRATPPQLQNALESFRQAVDQDSNNRTASRLLGSTYLMLAREKADDPQAAGNYLQQAREQFEACLAAEPKDIETMDYLAKVAVSQRDDVMQVNMYRKIIETAPDSPEAKDAQRKASIRGLKL